jgi:thermolabile hemolysin
MINKKVKAGFLVLLFAALIAGTAAGAEYQQVVAFGDSLTDNGNLLALTGGVQPDPDLYSDGHFSNGRVWVEYLADLLGADLVDNAYGGALTGEPPPGTPPGAYPPSLLAQIGGFIAGLPAPQDRDLSDILFVVWAGANDFLGSVGDDPESAVAAAVGNVANGVAQLVAAGAKTVVVLNLPDLGAVPRTVRRKDAVGATQLSLAFNDGLAKALSPLLLNPDVTVRIFNTFGLLTAISADPQHYGFGAADAICPNFLVPEEFHNEEVYALPYLFWDDIHPATETHAFLARRVAGFLGQIEAVVDIQPGSCTNPFNVRARGVLPVAVLGGADLDAALIDPASIRLNGVAPLRSSLADVAQPQSCWYGRDGLTDLVLKFSTPAVAASLGKVANRERVTLTLTGQLMDGTPISGEDTVWIIKSGWFKDRRK